MAADPMELLRRYFKERRGIDTLPECADELRQTVRVINQEVKQGKLGADADSMNRRLLSLMIPVVLEKQAARTAAASGFAAPQEPVAAPEPMDKDQMFMEKLKELEMTRSLPATQLIGGGGAAAQTSSQSPAVKSTMDLLLPAMQPVNLPAHIATVFMPAPPRRAQEVWIQSWQRNWVQYPGRNGFSWAGPLPPGTDLTQTRVVAVCLPEVFHRSIKSPYLVLRLEGVGGQSAQVILLPRPDVGTGWRLYEPAAADLGYLKPLACPWTVKLLNASGKTIDLGRDGDLFSAAQCAERADQWWVFGTNGAIYHWTEDTWDTGEPPRDMECIGLNFTRQWSVLLSAL